MYDPEVERRPEVEQRAADEALYRRQIAYLIARSPFYRRKLGEAGFADAASVGGLDDIARLPFTTKDELRESQAADPPLGSHCAADPAEVVRIYSTSGTTGRPCYIPLTAGDIRAWHTIAGRSYAASGVEKGERIVTTYGAGPFVAGCSLEVFHNLGLCHVPVGAGNTDRLVTALMALRPAALACTPSYATHIAEWAAERGIDVRDAGVRRILVAGEPGGGEPATRERIERAFGARVTETMGIGDLSISLWGECEHQRGMHFGGRGYVHFELIDPETDEPLPLADGARGELVYTAIRREAAPVLRFRSRDHVELWTEPCACGRTAPRVRCIGRTDDMLIVRGVNLFPSAVRDVVGAFVPEVSGTISIRPGKRGVRQDPPLRVLVERGVGGTVTDGMATRIEAAVRARLAASIRVDLVPYGTLPRSEYKAKLVDFSGASG